MSFLHASADKVLLPPTPPLPNQRQLQQRRVRGTAQSTASYAFGLDWLARLQQSAVQLQVCQKGSPILSSSPLHLFLHLPRHPYCRLASFRIFHYCHQD